MNKRELLLLIALGINLAIWVFVLIHDAQLCAGYICRG